MKQRKTVRACCTRRRRVLLGDDPVSYNSRGDAPIVRRSPHVKRWLTARFGNDRRSHARRRSRAQAARVY